jgi:VanZ family protein
MSKTFINRLRTHPVFRALCLLAAAFLVFNLFYVGTKPVAVGLFVPPWDKVAHFLFFSAIAALLWLGVNGRLPAIITLLVIAIGGLDELHQATLPGREADVFDFATDTAAALCTIYLFNWLNHRLGLPPRNKA